MISYFIIGLATKSLLHANQSTSQLLHILIYFIFSPYTHILKVCLQYLEEAPKDSEAVKRQASLLNLGTRFLQPHLCIILTLMSYIFQGRKIFVKIVFLEASFQPSCLSFGWVVWVGRSVCHNFLKSQESYIFLAPIRDLVFFHVRYFYIQRNSAAAGGGC